jgi:hypothetical protein
MNLYIFLIVLTICIGCYKNEKNQENDIKNKIDLNVEFKADEDYRKIIITNSEEINITNFFYDEIMNGKKDLSFHKEKYEVIDIFGEPLNIKVTEVTFNLVGGKVIEIRELIYDDFIHVYYIFEDGTIFYIGFIIEKKLERLKTINIGDTSERLLSIFSDKYYSWENVESIKENISYYTDPVECEIQFVINDKKKKKIYVNFLLI